MERHRFEGKEKFEAKGTVARCQIEWDLQRGALSLRAGNTFPVRWKLQCREGLYLRCRKEREMKKTQVGSKSRQGYVDFLFSFCGSHPVPYNPFSSPRPLFLKQAQQNSWKCGNLAGRISAIQHNMVTNLKYWTQSPQEHRHSWVLGQWQGPLLPPKMWSTHILWQAALSFGGHFSVSLQLVSKALPSTSALHQGTSPIITDLYCGASQRITCTRSTCDLN